MTGVYKITNTVNDKIYIGSSVDIEARRRSHFSDLKSGRHPNVYLQHSYNKYGADKFKHEVVEVVEDENTLRLTEQYWLDRARHEESHLLNISMFASGSCEMPKSPATRKKISDTLLAQNILPPSRAGVGYGFCKLYCPAKHYKTSKTLIHGSNSCKECQRLKSQKWRAEH